MTFLMCYFIVGGFMGAWVGVPLIALGIRRVEYEAVVLGFIAWVFLTLVAPIATIVLPFIKLED